MRASGSSSVKRVALPACLFGFYLLRSQPFLLQGLAALRARWGFLLVVDEAHASLVAGPRGGGGADAARACSAVDVSVGTLSKAAGAHGGFVACSSALRALLLNRGRSLVYSTALPLPAVAAARAALRVAAWCVRVVCAQQHSIPPLLLLAVCIAPALLFPMRGCGWLPPASSPSCAYAFAAAQA